MNSGSHAAFEQARELPDRDDPLQKPIEKRTRRLDIVGGLTHLEKGIRKVRDECRDDTINHVNLLLMIVERQVRQKRMECSTMPDDGTNIRAIIDWVEGAF